MSRARPQPGQPWLQPTTAGVRVRVAVVPRAGRSKVVGLHGGALKVSLAAAPVDGEANAELCVVLSEALDVPKRAVTIVQGQRNKTKLVEIAGVSAERVRALWEREEP